MNNRTPVTTKTCKDFIGAPSCCVSCHEDAIENYPDYPLSQIEDETGEVLAEVCCAALQTARDTLQARNLARQKLN